MKKADAYQRESSVCIRDNNNIIRNLDMRAGRREAVTFGAPNSSRTASAIRCSRSRLTWPRFARPKIKKKHKT